MDNEKTNQAGRVSKTQPVSSCPHCGVKLSSWEQVLLNVDRALMCKHCWYKIILDVGKDLESESNLSEEK
jgi:DNA-directed RNA polymerase subunit RPC12/RpoP